jgi:alkylation response protein AidB-like acyl-CoA dehydrogenase
MDLKLDEERTLLQETVRAFAKEKVRPHARDWEESRHIDDSALDAAWQLGFACADGEETTSALTNAIVLEEFAWADLGFALAATSPMHVVVPLVVCGHEGLKREILPSLFSSQSLPKATGAWIEPSRNYDLRSIAMRSQSTTQGPTLSGKKTLVPRGDSSTVTVVVARAKNSDEASEPYLALGEHVSGMSRGKKCDVIGPRAVNLVEMDFDECNVKRLAAKPAQLDERILVGTAAASLGVARAACDYAVDYARDRKAFGKMIAQNQSIAFMLAEAAMDVEAARWLVWKAAWQIDRGEPALVEASRAARLASDAAFKIADNCVQILGGHGVIRDHLAELFFRNARTLSRTTGWFIA